MKKALNIALGTVIAASLAAPAQANILDRSLLLVGGHYTEATSQGLNMGSTTTITNSDRYIYVTPTHELNYNLGLTHRFPYGSATRFFVDYEHFTQDKRRESGGVIVLAAPAGQGNTIGSVTDKERAVRAGLRHTLDFGPKFEVVLGGGIEWAKVQRTFQIAPSFGNRASETFNKAKGWGPTLEATGRGFPWGDTSRNWSIYSTGKLSVLYAENTFHYFERDGNGTVQAVSYNPEETQATMAKVEGIVGLTYNRLMRSDVTNLNLGINVGLKALTYINLLKSPDMTAAGAVGNYPIARYDWGRWGPFVEVFLGGGES